MSVSEPNKILTPWATSGLKNVIPSAANPVTGRAGYDLGFPAINMTAKEAGGIPPFGQDFNGILNEITKILQFIQAGGTPSYSSSLSSAVGGYAKGAIVMSTNGGTLWQNTTNGNATDPDSGGANWVDLILKILPKRSFSPSDFIRIPDAPGGLIIQWGQLPCSSGPTTTATFATSFPSSCLGVIHSGYQGSGNTQAYTVLNSTTPSNFVWSAFSSAGGTAPSLASAAAVQIRYIAIGF